MLVHLKHILGINEINQAKELLEGATFQDGKLSAGFVAQKVKNNEEAIDAYTAEKLNEIVMGNLVRHPTYNKAALPHKVAAPFYARYQPGMNYGEHIDDPIMGKDNRYRSDIAITIFISSPEEYEGGELKIQTPYSEQAIKYPAGDAVLYPATTRHQVMPVTKGERLVAVTWVQSLVRSHEQRDLLYQLNETREKMLRKNPDSEETKRIDLVYINLVRMWSDV